MRQSFRRAAVPLFALVLAACSTGANPTGPATTPAAPTQMPPERVIPPVTNGLATVPATQAPATGSAPTPSPAEPTPEPTAAELWRTAQLRDVRTGEMFTVDSLAGQLVVIEPMAIWCSSCRAQQTAAREALAALDNPGIAYVSLDIDPNEGEADLASYANQLEFPWRFVVASREVARSLAQTFGDQVLSPPSVPSIVVDPSGQVDLYFGHRGAEELASELTARLP